MNTKEKLNRYPQIMEEISNINTKIKELKELKELEYGSINAQVITGMPHGGGTSNPTPKTVELLIRKYDESIEALEQQKIKLLDLKMRIENAISELQPIERDIIQFRYFNNSDNNSWKVISNKIGKSEVMCMKISNKLLSKIKI